MPQPQRQQQSWSPTPVKEKLALHSNIESVWEWDREGEREAALWEREKMLLSGWNLWVAVSSCGLLAHCFLFYIFRSAPHLHGVWLKMNLRIFGILFYSCSQRTSSWQAAAILTGSSLTHRRSLRGCCICAQPLPCPCHRWSLQPLSWALMLPATHGTSLACIIFFCHCACFFSVFIYTYRDDFSFCICIIFSVAWHPLQNNMQQPPPPYSGSKK